MQIISLVENTSRSGLKTVHGLSLYIETDKHKILFDLGPDNTVFANAKKKNINLEQIDTVIISHGHRDHGGAMKKFLEVNSGAKIYIQEKAFLPHYTKAVLQLIPIGLNKRLKKNERVVLLNGDFKIDDELSLFTVEKTDKCYSSANDVLYENDHRDTFEHEQNLIISADKTVLVIGCGHTGIVNIMEKAEAYKPSYCIGGFHLHNPVFNKTVSGKLLKEIADFLKKQSNTEFYTCHCTGIKAFTYLSSRLKNLHYFSCGDTIDI